jgi:tetratricopeptide (TPR) repeat protein
MALMTGRALADAPNEPWKAGISDEVQERANALFAEANQEFAHGAHTHALELYEQASALWDHPLIHFNKAVTLVKLDRYLEAADALDHALEYGEAPYTAESYKQVQENKRLVDSKLGRVEATCTQRDTNVLLDGTPWFTCPGTKSQRVLAGEHTVYADRKGALPRVRKIQVRAAGTERESIELMPLDKALTMTRRMPVWVPYAVLVAGAAMAIGGVVTYKDGSDTVAGFDTALAVGCTVGCSAAEIQALTSQRAHGQDRMDTGVIEMTVGSALLATGIALAVINQPQRRIQAVDLALSHRSAAITARWSF